MTIEWMDNQRVIPILSDDVSWDVYIRPEEVDENQTFPPNRFRQRDDRIEELTSLWRGELAGIDLKTNPVIPNLFYSYSTKVANLLTMSEPEAEGVDSGMLVNVAYDALVDMTRYGGALLMRLDNELSVPSPANWYPTRENGDYFVSAFLSDEADSNVLDRLDVIVVPPEGAADRMTYNWDAGVIGSLRGTEALGDASVRVVQRVPRAGVWGTPKYLEIFSVAAEIAKRYSMNSAVLDLYTKPVTIFKWSDVDAAARFAPGVSDVAKKREMIEAGLIEQIRGTTMQFDDSLLDLMIIQPSTQGIATALSQIDHLMEVFRDMTGIPNLQGQTLTGEALKQLYVNFIAETRSMQNVLRNALADILETEINWPHIFEVQGGIFASPNVAEPVIADPAPEVEDELEIQTG